MSDRIRLYPYRVTYIDAIYSAVVAQLPLALYTDVVRAPNSEEAKKLVASQNPDRPLMFLNSTRHPENRPQPDLCEYRIVAPYQVKILQDQIAAAAVARIRSEATKTADVATKPIGTVTAVPTDENPFLKVKLNTHGMDMLSVGGFTVAVMNGKPTSFTSTATTFPAVAPANHARVQPVDDWSQPIGFRAAAKAVPDPVVTDAVSDVMDSIEGGTFTEAYGDAHDPVETFHPTAAKPDIAGIDAVLERERSSYTKPFSTPVVKHPTLLERFVRRAAFLSGVISGRLKKTQR